jgi:hypothetical protein
MASNDRPLRLSRTVILAKIEVDEGIDPTPTGASDAVQITEGTLTLGGEVLDRKPLSTSMAPKAPVQGTLWWEFTCTVEAKTNGNADAGTVGNKVEYDTLMRICGLAVAYEAGTRIRYRPASDPANHETATIYVYFDGVRHILTACRGNVEYTTTAGNFGTFTFTIMGKYNAPTDAALPTTANIYQTQPPVLHQACVDLGSPSVFNPIIESFGVNMNNEVGPRLDPCSTYAVKGFLIGDRNTQGTYNPEATLVADHVWFTDFTAKTERLLDVQNGTTAGQIVQVKVPKSVIREMPYGERETFRTFEISYTAAGGTTNNGDDEVEFIFR